VAEIALRDYQEEAVGAVLGRYREGVKRQLLVLPTGAGKTVVAAEIARRLGERVLFLVHRDELVWQAVEKFGIVWPEASCGVVKGPRRELGRQVTVASVQTASRPEHLARLGAGYGLVVCDEAHHAVAPSWQRVLERVRAGEDGLLLGITATPARSDRVGLGGVFEEVVYEKAIMDLVRAGYLVPPAGLKVQTRTDLSGVGSSGDDFDERQLEAVVNTANRNQLIAAALAERARERKCLVFCAGVSHSLALRDVLEEFGFRAAHLDGSTPEEKRRQILRDFRSGRVRVLTNCGVLLEGYDEPSCDCVVLARPTRSQPLYAQMVGRGLRLYPGKRDCLVVDCADLSARYRLVTLADLTGGQVKDRGGGGEAARGTGPAQPEFDFQPVGTGLVCQEVDLAGSPFRWILVGGSAWVLSLGRDEVLALVPAGDGYRAFSWDGGSWRALHSRPLPLDWAQGVAEEAARRSGGLGLAWKRAAWLEMPVTPGQADLLRRWGYDPVSMNRGQAAEIITRRIWERRVAALRAACAGRVAGEGLQ